MSKTWTPYARHILEAIARIRRIQQRGALSQDEVLYAASLRHLQTLSEATQRLPAAFQSEHPDIPWREISGFRNILVHNYLGDIDPLTVQGVIDQHLGPLASAVQAMLDAHPDTP